jgi:hypothetical protein
MDAKTKAQIICNPSLTTAQNICAIAHLDNSNMNAIAEELQRQAEQIKDGDLSQVELSLWSSVIELDILHSHLQKKALGSLQNNGLLNLKPEIVEFLFNAALKIQIEKRKTLTALAQIKNPKRATFIKQQLNQLNQLIQQNNDTALDRIGEATTARINQNPQTLEALDRGANFGGKEKIGIECH